MEPEARLTALRKEKKIFQQAPEGTPSNVSGRHERGEGLPWVEMASKLSKALGVLLGCRDNTDAASDKIISIQKLAEEDKTSVMRSIDGRIQYVKTKSACAAK